MTPRGQDRTARGTLPRGTLARGTLPRGMLPRGTLRIATMVGFTALGIGVACGKSDKLTGPAGQLQTIVVSPSTDTIIVGNSQTFTATGKDASGRTVSGLTFFWSSSSTATATVTQSGQATAEATGLVKIAASVAGISGLATVIVAPRPVGSIVIVPSSATLRIATTLQLRDTVKDASGTVLSGQTVTWSSDSAPIAAVDGNGLVTARALGTAHITAASGGKQAQATITVSQVPVASITITPANPSVFVTQTTQLTAITKDSAGTVLPGRVVRWSTGAPAVATIDSVAGLLTGVGAGSTITRAKSEGITDSVTATVSAAPANTVVLSPSLSQVDVGANVTLTASVTNSLGVPIPNPTVNFLSNQPTIASVTGSSGATGQILAGPNAGTATITGTSGTATGTATIIVSLTGVDSVHITAARDTLTPNQIETLTATAYDSGGNPLTGRVVSWQSTNPGVATVNAGGTVTARTPGVAVIFATISGVRGSLALIVNPVPVGSVTISPQGDTIQVLGQLQLQATVRDVNGTIINPSQTWYSLNTSIAVVTSSGLVTGVGPGVTSIIDSVGGKADTNTTAVLAPVASVTLSPNPAMVTIGATQTLTASLEDSHGSALTATRRTLVWTSSNHGVDTVSQAGVVYPVAAGVDTITLTINQPTGNVNGISAVTVSQVPVASVVVYPTPDTIFATAPNDAIQLLDSTKDAGGANLSGRPVTWSITSGTTATANPTGRVTGNNTAAGPVTVTATNADKPSSGNATVLVLGHGSSSTANVVLTTLSLSGSATTTATAAILDTFGNPVEAGRPVVWTTSDPTTVTINGSAAGSVTTTAGATVTLTAVSTNSGQVNITVAPVDNASAVSPPVSITVNP